jgi:hypothetical protein
MPPARHWRQSGAVALQEHGARSCFPLPVP